MTDTEEDIASPASKPQDETSRSCTKWTACKEACCPSCSTPITGNHHVRNFSQEMATTPPPKRLIKPTAPPHHYTSVLSTQLKQASLDNNIESIQIHLYLFETFIKKELDSLNYDLTELLNSVETAKKLTSTQIPLAPGLRPPRNHWLTQGIDEYLEIILGFNEQDGQLGYLTNTHRDFLPLMRCHFPNWLFDRALLTAIQDIATIILNSAEHLYDEENVDWSSEPDMNQDQYDEENVDWDLYDEENVACSSEPDINQDLYNKENVDWSYEQDRNQYDNSELFKTSKPDCELIEPGTLPTPKSKTSNPASVAALGMGTFGISPTRLLITPPPKETTESKPMPTKDSLSQPLLAGSAGKYPDPTNVESVETLNLATRVTEIQEVQIAEFSNTPIPNLNPEKDESIQHNLTPSREDGVTAPPDPTVTHKDVIINPPVPTINLRKTSIISRFQEQFTMFDSKILSKPAVNLDADSYLGTTCLPLPSFLVQPDLKPPWNLYKREVY